MKVRKLTNIEIEESDVESALAPLSRVYRDNSDDSFENQSYELSQVVLKLVQESFELGKQLKKEELFLSLPDQEIKNLKVWSQSMAGAKPVSVSLEAELKKLINWLDKADSEEFVVPCNIIREKLIKILPNNDES